MSEKYKGSSAQYWHNKANAYKNAIIELHEILPKEENGAVDIVDKVKEVLAANKKLKARVKELESVLSGSWVSEAYRDNPQPD